MSGKVYLVGAGPGDPGLITVKGLEVLRAADVVVHDYLANPRLLSEVRPECELIFVGKRHDKHYMEQDEINRILITQAQAGKAVVRLKGGDPFVFGRGGEEATELVAHGVPFEVVPGVSSAYAVPAYAGIPVTHRHLASDVAFVTGHQVGQGESDIDWQRLALGVGTLVFLMGVTNLSNITGELMKHGRAPETPVAVIRWGTMPEQQTVTGTLSDIGAKIRKASVHPPAVVVVGEVVKLRDKLAWFEKKPLAGRRVVITRGADQASGFIKELESLGAEAIPFPTILTRPLVDPVDLDAAIGTLGEYSWVVFTSANAVGYFVARLRHHNLDLRALGSVKVAAIGPASAAALAGAGITADMTPADYVAEGLVAEFEKLEMAGVKVLLPRAVVARDVLPEQLREMGAQVSVAPCYETVTADSSPERVAGLLRTGKVSYVTFTSGSTVKGYAEILASESDVAELLAATPAVCIGSVTEKTARELGLKVALVADESTTAGMVAAILKLVNESKERRINKEPESR